MINNCDNVAEALRNKTLDITLRGDQRLTAANISVDKFVVSDAKPSPDHKLDMDILADLDPHAERLASETQKHWPLLVPRPGYCLWVGPMPELNRFEIYVLLKAADVVKLVGGYRGDTVYVRPQYVRQGLGSELILAAYAQARDRWSDLEQCFTESGKRAFENAYCYAVVIAKRLSSDSQ